MIVGICAAVVGLAPAALATPTKKTVYQGATDGVEPGRVTLTVFRTKGEPKSARIAVSEVPVTCEDGTTDTTFGPRDYIDVGFHGSKRTFDGRAYNHGQPTAPEEYARVHGRLLPGGRAEGYVLLYVNPWDPPGEPGFMNAPECTTPGGQLRWTAHR